MINHDTAVQVTIGLKHSVSIYIPFPDINALYKHALTDIIVYTICFCINKVTNLRKINRFPNKLIKNRFICTAYYIHERF